MNNSSDESGYQGDVEPGSEGSSYSSSDSGSEHGSGKNGGGPGSETTGAAVIGSGGDIPDRSGYQADIDGNNSTTQPSTEANDSGNDSGFIEHEDNLRRVNTRCYCRGHETPNGHNDACGCHHNNVLPRDDRVNTRRRCCNLGCIWYNPDATQIHYVMIAAVLFVFVVVFLLILYPRLWLLHELESFLKKTIYPA